MSSTAFAACCLIALACIAHADFSSYQRDAFGGTDIGVYKLPLFRTNGPEDIDAARRKRNVLVSRASWSMQHRECWAQNIAGVSLQGLILHLIWQ